MKKFAMTAALALMVGASGSAMAAGATKHDAANAINAAIQETEAAAKVHYEWRDTYKIIGKAKADYHKGKYDKAVKLANKAMTQSKLAIMQQKAEAHAGIPDYVKAASK